MRLNKEINSGINWQVLFKVDMLSFYRAQVKVIQYMVSGKIIFHISYIIIFEACLVFFFLFCWVLLHLKLVCIFYFLIIYNNMFCS